MNFSGNAKQRRVARRRALRKSMAFSLELPPISMAQIRQHEDWPEDIEADEMELVEEVMVIKLPGQPLATIRRALSKAIEAPRR